MKKINLLLLAIFITGFLLRVISLDRLPVGFTPDEASFAYDAYSLLNTGKDQWGNYWPLVLKSFGDYKMPLLTYLSIPSVLVFGLSEFSVRLPNALLGSFAIISVYFLVKELYNKKTALFSAFLIAISPWHIALSRGAFEANLTTFLMPSAILFFIYGIKKPRMMALSSFLFGLNVFSYHSARIVVPLVLLSLVYAYRRGLKENFKKYIYAYGVLALFVTLGFVSLLQGSALRASTSTIFSNTGSIFTERFSAINAGEPVFIAKIFNNKITYLVDRFFVNYSSYFSVDFLFLTGAREGTYGMVPGIGVMLPVELLFLTVLLVFLIKGKIKMPFWLVVWMLIAPLPAAISLGPGYAANRAAVMMPAIQILSGLGLYLVYKHLSFKMAWTKTLLALLVILFFAVFLESYIYSQPSKAANAMIYGTRELFIEASKYEQNYNEIIVSKNISEAHIFVAFYNKIDPGFYQQETVNWNFEDLGFNWVDQLPEYHLGKYTFKTINWNDDIKVSGRLFLAEADSVPENFSVLQTIYYPNGTPAYKIVDTKITDFAQAI